MTQHQTSRTLVKSAPELWAECSDAASLARHLGAFGEIRITKLEPETAVAWEGTAACGTVTLEPSGWGTRVTLTLTEEAAAAEEVATPDPPAPVLQEVEPAPEVPVAAAEEPVAEAPSAPAEEPVADALFLPAEGPAAAEPAVRVGMFGRFMRRFRARDAEVPVVAEPDAVAAEPVAESEVAVEPEAAVEPDPDLTPPATDGAAAGEEALARALDSLGRAHHRPYSRA